MNLLKVWNWCVMHRRTDWRMEGQQRGWYSCVGGDFCCKKRHYYKNQDKFWRFEAFTMLRACPGSSPGRKGLTRLWLRQPKICPRAQPPRYKNGSTPFILAFTHPLSSEKCQRSSYVPSIWFYQTTQCTLTNIHTRLRAFTYRQTLKHTHAHAHTHTHTHTHMHART